MKRLIIFVVLALVAILMSAQAPEKLKYQAVIRDHENRVLANRAIGMRIQVISGSEEGTVVYAETHAVTSGSDGLVSIGIGSGTVISGNFDTIDWSTGSYFAKTEIDPAGGTSYILEGTGQLLSVPYAFYAKTAERTDAITESQGLPDVLAINDSAGMPIKNVTDPTDDLDAATVAYFINQMFRSGLIRGEHLLSVVPDIEGNLYRTVRIGDMRWMDENLRTTKYNDGTNIPLVTDNTEWGSLTSPAYCWYGNAASNAYSAVTCGALYNWYAINTEKLCPDSWHVPTLEDFNNLITELGGLAVAGGKLKEAGTKHWMIPNEASNESDFRGLPGGFRSGTGFDAMGNNGLWWSSTEAGLFEAYSLGLINNFTITYLHDISKKTGISVRCVSEAPASILIPGMDLR
ncbi:MAG: hypothetical protein JXR41_16370 [Bacteroidales bacterium]|nr:hypothetical protein [Bacteroidales bacterium]MBN2764670.1 hypothetical protein [Bacteroidales bacterium]